MFCIQYFKNGVHKYLEYADELKIYYDSEDSTLPAFLDKYKDKTIIINIPIKEKMDLNFFKSLYEQHPNFKLCLTSFAINFEEIQEIGIPYFFTHVATTIDEVYGLINYKVSDIYVGEDMGFILDKVAPIIHKHNIKVRIYPNICQSSWETTPAIKTFFVRPDDIDLYSKYVDVFDLISDADRQVILKIYHEKKWLGNLSEIIPSFTDDVNNMYLLNTFGKYRVSCGKKCLLNPEGGCQMCDVAVDLSKTLTTKIEKVKAEKEKNL